MSKLLAVVGDVHGDARRLESMLAALRPRGGRIVLAGDYVDRGPGSADVLEMLAAEVKLASGLIALAGNHETELTLFIDSGDFVRFAAGGGMATIRSYVGEARGDVHRQFTKAFPRHHESLIRSLPTHYEDDSVLVSHAGFDPLKPTLRTRDTMVDGRFANLLTDVPDELPRPVVVCGHYVQKTKEPFEQNGLYCVDTGCGTIGGPLTALLLPEREFVSI